MAALVQDELLERESELIQLEGALEDARAGRGRLLVLEGPPGIGKTRLLEATTGRAHDRDMRVLSARGTELERDFPFGLVRQLFEPLLARSPPSRRKALLHGAAGLAAPLFGMSSPDGEGGEPTGADASFATFHALYWLTASVSEREPLVLAVDDVHWSDASSLHFFLFLLPRLEELPVLLALAARPAEPGAESQLVSQIASDRLALLLHPSPLSGAAVTALVESTLGGDAHPDFCGACQEATDGNPFLLRELLREFSLERVSPTREEAARVRDLAPRTVARTVLLRLSRLRVEASALARAVAVLGDGVDLRRAATLAVIDLASAGDAADALADADILAPARPLAFAHPILRSAVYSDIEPAARARAHKRAAELLVSEHAKAEEIALHLLATESAGDGGTVETLRDAGRRALARGAAPAAVACLRRALAEPPVVEARADVLFELASAEFRAGEVAAAVEHFEEAWRLRGDPRVRAANVRQLAYGLISLGRRDEAFELLEQAIDAVAESDRDLALRLEAELIALARLDRSRLAWARKRLERHRGGLEGESPGERLLLATLAHASAFGGDASAARAAELAERALAEGRLLVDSGGEFPPFYLAIEVLVLADRVEPAKRALDEAVEAGSRRGSAVGFGLASAWRCWLLARQGALVEAEADGRNGIELALTQGWLGAAPLILGFLIDVLVDRGELSDAEELLERSGMADKGSEKNLMFYPLLFARGRLRLAQGDLERSVADLTATTRAGGSWNTYLSSLPPVVVAPELAAGQRDEAKEIVEEILRQARAWSTPRAIGIALRAAGLVEGGERGVELLREAVAVLEPSPARLEHARALTELGGALRRSNQRSAARDPLRLGLDIAQACGARPLAERAREELVAAGGRPRRPRVSGAEALTASEQRIAKMAADGLSNSEIAQALFVTKKTVEAHLSNAYRKLDIGSRSELQGALVGDEEGGPPRG